MKLKCLLALFIVVGGATAEAAGTKILRGHVPDAGVLTQPLGHYPGTNTLRLALSLPLRNAPDLTNLLGRLYDPASPDYHHYLTPAQFNDQFGPTAQDYQKVIDFAVSNNFQIVSRHDSRMMVDVQAQASDAERAFHVSLQRYQHPRENREFHVPNTDPTVDAGLPILDVVGLGNYAVPRPAVHMKTMRAGSVSAAGSQANGYLLGRDFRNAYAPGVSLNGAGQIVGLLELDGYYSNDIVSYEALAGYTNVPVQNINADNYSGAPGSGVVEVTLDIEVAIAMAPGLSSVAVFQAGPSTGLTGFEDILESMASSTNIRQFSSSWGFTGVSEPNSTIDGYLQKMIAQGQSFFEASGDGDAWVNPIWAPADSPYLTCVGGTTLTMNGSGASYASEAVWNEGNLGSGNGWSANEATSSHGAQNDYIGSGGGVSSSYSIPSWQTSAVNTSNHGSSTRRNIPDVALTGDNIWIIYGNGSTGAVGGTSCAAPLWAAFTALVNQQAAAWGDAPVGFLNPALYALAKTTNYATAFHDIASGNDTNLQSANLWVAVPGYDLCTGLGTPNGSAMIAALLPAPAKSVASLTWPNPATISYGVALDSTQLNATASVAGAFIYNPPAGTVLTAGTHILSVTFTPTDTTDYTNSTSTATLVVSRPTLTVTASNASRFFGQNNPVFTGSIAGLSNGDVITATFICAAASNSAVGTYPIVPTLVDPNNRQTNYVTALGDGTLTVEMVSPVLSWAPPAPVQYGAVLGSSQLNASANVPGGFAYTPPAGTVPPPGANTLTVLFTPADVFDYTTAADSVNLTVTLAPVPLNVQMAGKNIVLTWNDADSVFILQSAPAVNGTYTNVPGATSPYTNAMTGDQSYFRLIVPPQ